MQDLVSLGHRTPAYYGVKPEQAGRRAGRESMDEAFGCRPASPCSQAPASERTCSRDEGEIVRRLRMTAIHRTFPTRFVTDEELIQNLEKLRSTMAAVATGGPRIPDVNDEFQRIYSVVAAALVQREITNPLPYGSLWEWYGRWSSGDMPSWQSRRTHIAEIFSPLINRLKTGRVGEFEPTGWVRVDRSVGELRNRLASATAEEHFQAVALLCREALISVAQAVFDPERHPSLDGVAASPTDVKRMLECYIAVELGGAAHEYARRHARAALDFSVNLQHKRTANFREAAMCVEATTAVVNTVAIVSGRRDPR
jgi:hypothetical protein